MTLPPLTVLGLMSGTSVDGLDAAVVQVRDEGEALVARVLAYCETSFDPALRDRVHLLFSPEQSRVDEVCEVNVLLGEAFAAAARSAADRAGVEPDLVASHGQTIWHQVAPGHVRSTLQVGEPSVLAERLGATVVADFRPRDVAAGGQGAPISSWCDALLFGDPVLSRAVQNLGGIGNVTWIPPGGDTGQVLAFDTGPGNALIDHAVWRLSRGEQRYDRDGAIAARGQSYDELVAELLRHPYFSDHPPKTTGRELFGAPFADAVLDRLSQRGRSGADAVATLTAFTARSIADQYRRFLPRPPDEVIVGGGGAKNPALMAMLRDLLPSSRVRPHEDFGLPSTGREAIYFALLGHEALHGRPNTIPSCTGARHAVCMGKIVPGPNYRSLLERIVASRRTPSTRILLETGASLS